MTKLNDSSNLDGQKFTILFKGLSYRTFATCIWDIANESMIFEEFPRAPHEYFNYTYASLQNYSSVEGANEIIFSRDMRGNVNYPATHAEVKLSVGDIITVLHEEAQARLDVFNDTQGVKIGITSNVNSWQITEQGLVFVEQPHNPYPVANVRGNEFAWDIYNSNEEKLLNIGLDIMMAKITFNYNNGYMNPDSQDVCLSVRLQNKVGELVYHQDFNGDEGIIAQSTLLPFYEGYQLFISNHFWATSKLINNETNVLTTVPQQKITVTNVDKGLFSSDLRFMR
jgi:hypothetical protein